MAGLLDKYAGKKLERFEKPRGLLNIIAENPKEAAGLLADFTPVVGEMKSAYEGLDAAQQGDWKMAALGALGALPLVGTMARGVKAGKSVPRMMGQSGQIVWHGSPHKFDKFDMSKIGTGEGAQAYGHGLYTAEAQQVGKEYADRLAGDYYKAGGELFNPADIKHLNVRAMVRNGDLDGAIQKAATISNSDSGVANLAKLDLDLLQKAKDAGGLNKAEGYLYKVDIPDEAVARFLDWDKPLSQQAPEVQAALKSMADDVTKGGFDLSRSPRNVARAFDNSSTDEAFKLLQEKYGVTNSGGQYFDKNGNPVSADAVRRHIDKIAGKGYENAGQLYSDLTHILGSQADISATLRNNGIPGIRYLDGGSRSAGQGSSNFVLFDDQLPRILEINGQATGNVPWQPNEWRGLLNP